MKIDCKCGESFVVIVENKNVTCGVNGVEDIKNVRISKGQVICVKCNSTIYEQKN